MKTIFKSLLYFSFAGLILTGCAKNDDFSVPPINCDEPTIAATQTIDGLYTSLTENSKEVVLYPKDEIISGIVISSDQAGNFYQQLYIVDENTQTPVTLKVDVKGGFALYPVGSKVFMKLKDTYIHYSYGMITIGGGIYTSSGGNKYADVITGSKLRTSLFRSCNVITGDDFNKYINEVTLDQFATDKKLFGKLVRIKDVQFERDIVGKTYFDAKDVDGGGQTLRKMIDKKGNSLQVRTGKYANGIKDQIITDQSGTVTGIMSDYQGTLQFAPRTMGDMALDQKPFDKEPEIPGVQEELKMLGTHIFKGADFENWDSFLGYLGMSKQGTEEYKIRDYVKAVADNYSGVTGKQALHINGTPANNEAIFTLEGVPAHKGATKLSFIMKGKSKKALSINVYKDELNAKGFQVYEAFNVINYDDASKNTYKDPATTLGKSITLKKAPLNTNGDGSNSYLVKNAGGAEIVAIDTKGTWVKVTLDLSDVKYNASGSKSFLAIRVGNKDEVDLKIDEIRFEDGTPGDGGTTGPEVPGGDDDLAVTQKTSLGALMFMGADFTNAADFAKVSIDRTPIININKIEGGVMKIDGKATANGYLMTAQNSTTHFAAKGKKSIVVRLKGTAVGKSLSINVYAEKGLDKNQFNENYYCYNFGDITTSTAIEAKKGNNYGGSIDTKGQWVDVTLPIPDGDYYRHSDKAIFSIKVGKDGVYNLEIDSITLK